MAIKHVKVSAIPDGGDATLVRPSDWNDNHQIDAATITLAHLANLANQRLIGRNTAGAGVPEAVTASQLFDWISSTNGVLLTRTGGAWAAAANVAIDSGDLVVSEVAAPAAAPASKVRLHGAFVGGRGMPSAIGPTGGRQVQQPFLGQRASWWVLPRNDGGAAFTAYNTRLDIQGTLTARVPAATNLCTAAHRIAYVSAAGAGSIAGARSASASVHRGNVAGAGGFHKLIRFAISDAVLVATAHMFVGLHATLTSLGDVGPETLANCIGVGCTSGDTQLQLYAADATPRARTALGAAFPCNTISTDVYEFSLYSAPNGADVTYELVRLNTGDRASGTISASANLPLPTQFLTWQIQRSNGGNAAAVGIDILGVYGEADT